MKLPIWTVLLSMIASSGAQADQAKASPASSAVPTALSRPVTHVAGRALDEYRQSPARSEPWQRADLEARDRSIVTLAALIARNQTAQMPCHFNLALENGVEPNEISEIITHLAFFSGWANSMSAVAMAKDVFAERGIDDGQLAPTLSELFLVTDELSLDDIVGSPRLLRSLWLRPSLSPRDRKLATVSALIALGHIRRIPHHLIRAMDDGSFERDTSEAVQPRS